MFFIFDITHAYAKNSGQKDRYHIRILPNIMLSILSICIYSNSFHRKGNAGILEEYGVMGDFCGGLFTVKAFLVGVAHIVSSIGRGNIQPDPGTFLNQKGVLIEGKTQRYQRARYIARML